MFQLPSGLGISGKVNPQLADQQRLPFASQYNQAVDAYQSDTMRGTMVNGVPYNSFTFTQQKMLGAYAELANQQAPGNVIYPDWVWENISQNPGPNEIWNLSYNGWGFDVTVAPSNLLLFVNAVDRATGKQVAVVMPK